MERLKKVILCFCMSFFVFINSSVCVFASDLNDGVNDGFDRYMGGTNIKGFNSWEITDKKSLFATNIGTFFAEIGMYFKGQSNQTLLDIFTEHLIETNRIENADSLDSYIASHLTSNDEETELYMSADLTNSLHETAVQYIEEETGFVYGVTFTPEQLYSKIDHKSVYDALVGMCNNLASDEIMCFSSCSGGTGTKYYGFFTPLKIDGLVGSLSSFSRPFYEWEIQYFDLEKYYFSDGTFWETIENYDKENFVYFANCTTNPLNNTSYSRPYVAVSKTPKTYRIFKSMDEYKAYSIGTRTYFTTDNFVNYDSTVDNSTTITQTEIDNSVTYGDVYNYITNNYENPDGLSEDELRAILAEYLSSINNSGGGSGDSDNGSDSGGGLGGFLDGLGSIGNAIMAILGKLMEILGSAIELITGSITDLITLIPNSIGELLSALFPVFPEEWIKAITLSLVLGVIIGIVRIFK